MKIYHETDLRHLFSIIEHGLIPLEGIFSRKLLENIYEEYKGESLNELIAKTKNPIWKVREFFNEIFPEHESSVFFWKSLNDVDKDTEMIIEVESTNVPCQCKEANYDAANNLFNLLMDDYLGNDVNLSDIKEAEDNYKKSIRDLDNKKNKYKTEVFCPCPIPPYIINPKDYKKLIEKEK